MQPQLTITMGTKEKKTKQFYLALSNSAELQTSQAGSDPHELHITLSPRSPLEQ